MTLSTQTAEDASSVARSQAADSVQIVTFEIAGQAFGFDVFDVQEIVRHRPVTAVPEAPDFLEGVMELRGLLIPVVDLRKRLSTEVGSMAEARVVVVAFAEDRLGLVVDAVSEVLRVADDAMVDPPDYVRGIAARYVRKLVRLDERIIILLDLDQILTSAERIALAEAEWEASGEEENPDDEASDRERGQSGTDS